MRLGKIREPPGSGDRGKKLDHYKRIPSLRECVLVSHRTPELELWRRENDVSWVCLEARTGGSLELLSIGGVARVDDVYRRALDRG